MVICRFFLQGNCKFGDYCKNDHQINDDFSNHQLQSTSILRQSHFGNQFQTNNMNKEKNTSTPDLDLLIKSIITDMTTAEKSGQWCLTAYTPFKDKPLFPGFEDHSFEEIRLGYYEARNNGTLEQYKQQLNLMIQQSLLRIKSLQNPSVDVINVLKSLYSTSSANQDKTSTSTNIFSNNMSPSIFGGQAPSGNIFSQNNTNIQGGNSIFGTPTPVSAPVQPAPLFGGTTSPTNSFSSSNNIFLGNQPPNVFGQNNTNVQSNSIFGTQTPVSSPGQSGSIFGGTANSNASFNSPNNIFLGNQPPNVFGQSPQQPTQSSGLFASQAPTILQQPNLFNTAPVQAAVPPQNMFGMDNIPNSNVFGASLNAQTSNIFGAQSPIQQQSPNSQGQSPGLFGLQNPQNLQQAPSLNVFGTPQNVPASIPQQPQQLFGSPVIQQAQTQNSTNIFGAPPNVSSNSPFVKSNSEIQSHTTNIFGAQTFGNVARNQNEPFEEEIYSKLEDLTEEEVKWFQSDDLSNFNIPEKPPTYEMCFKA